MIADASTRIFFRDLYYRLDSPSVLIPVCLVLVAALIVLRVRKR